MAVAEDWPTTGVRPGCEPALLVEELLDDVEVVQSETLGGDGLVAKKAFSPGQVALRERPLAHTETATNGARVMAYCSLSESDRRRFLGIFSEGSEGCVATAPCMKVPDNFAESDSASEVFAALDGEHRTTLEEVKKVIRVWNLNAYGNAVSVLISKINHSCNPNVFISVDPVTKHLSATAVRPIAQGEALGSWYFQETPLYWMGQDRRDEHFQRMRGFACGCERCSSFDVCRGLPCPGCSGTVYRCNGIWKCGGHKSGCGYEGRDSDMPLDAEADLVQQTLSALRPRPGEQRNLEELQSLGANVQRQLGTEHWAAAAMGIVMHYRGRAATSGKICSMLVALDGLIFLDWLLGRNLPIAPARVLRTPISMAVDIAYFFSRGSHGIDGRCLAGRLTKEFILPILAGSCSDASLAGLQTFWGQVAELSAFSEGLKSCCGECGKTLEEKGRMTCGQCRQIFYCSKDCQLRDWKRQHKRGCIPHGDRLSGARCRKLLEAS